MGLTSSSVGINAVDSAFNIIKQNDNDKVIALAGNPNVGKSTVFNALTGMKQHTGNWPGKTVAGAQGYCSTENHSFVMVDIPGTYSLLAHSAEEEVARNFICFGNPDAVIVVCDATCLERNLNLVLQTMEISSNVIVCVNLMDEAKRKGIKIDLKALSKELGTVVVGTSAQNPKTLDVLLDAMDKAADVPRSPKQPETVRYPQAVEDSAALIEPVVKRKYGGRLNSRWLSLKLIDRDASLIKEINTYLGEDILNDKEIAAAVELAVMNLDVNGIDPRRIKELTVSSLVRTAEHIAAKAVHYEKKNYDKTDRTIDKILTSRLTGYPLMLLMLLLIFWITITGANYPSQIISDILFKGQDKLTEFFHWLNAPEWLHGVLVLGIYRVLAWVVSVMLPPMAIFFPLFTLLEDSGYLPRVAYNLDRPFKRCNACGKQSLTMCMGFGCNAAGIVGCRIIDSPRERLLAILTNNFVPCNGRFPTIISILTMFFVGFSGGAGSSLLSAALLTAVILLGIAVTFGVTKLLSKTLLKGVPSSYTLELPPYRKPQILKVLVRSIFDRTLFVLGRAAVVAIPAGLIIWLMANVTVNDVTLLSHCAAFLDPFARFLGMDGIILMAFILGLPANEIVVPIIIMGYMAQGSIIEFDDLEQMRQLFADNGWNFITAVCVMLFSLMHWPCSTTLITIKKETGSLKWTVIAALIPTVVGMAACALFANIARVFI